MRVLVTGGRKFNDIGSLTKELNFILSSRGVDVIIHGDGDGADRMAGYWAEDAGIAVESHGANWKQHGKAAGPIRNSHMLEHGKPDLVVAFPGGKGTADMVTKARKAGVEVYEVL